MSKLQSTYLRRLQTKPSYSKYITIHWADYIELICLANLDGEVSEYDVIDRFEERERDLYEGDPDDIDEMKSFEEEDGEIATRRAEIDDKWKIRVEDWFKVLSVRASLYGEDYPFVVSEKEIKIKDSLSPRQKIYVYLLLCSNLYLVDKASQNVLANAFELISFDALKAILPPNAQIHLFGSNPYNRSGRYHSNLSFWERTNTLASDLFEHVNPKISESQYPKANKGDGGLDIVAWIPTGDKLPSMPIFFGQCACTTEWISKQNDSAFPSWANRINLTTHTTNIVFIPFCYRGADGSWFRVADIRLSFLIDRKRILFYLSDTYDKFEKLPFAGIVQTIIDTKENIV